MYLDVNHGAYYKNVFVKGIDNLFAVRAVTAQIFFKFHHNKFSETKVKLSARCRWCFSVEIYNYVYT